MKKILQLYLLLTQLFVCISQDIHFSQAFSSPLSLNPASTGNIDGKIRFNCNYKDQWRSISKPYKTIYASVDYTAFKKKKIGSYLGIGLTFYNDKAGTSNLTTNETSLLIAYNIKMNKYNFLAAGLGFSFAQKSINLNGLKWDNQFNGITYDASMGTKELINGKRTNYINFSSGLLWNTLLDTKNKISTGASIFHINKANQSLVANHNDHLATKLIIHSSAQFRIGRKNSSFVPLVLFSNQNKFNEFLFGSMIKYDLGLESRYTNANRPSYVSLGCLYRVNDAIIILLNIDYKQIYNFGFRFRACEFWI